MPLMTFTPSTHRRQTHGEPEHMLMHMPIHIIMPKV